MFRTFVGIDQTGAVVRGVPRPLPVACLDAGGKLTIGHLANADQSAIVAFAGTSRALAILVDAVIGLPGACWRGRGADDVWSLLRRAHETPGYGRVVAETFFSPFIPPGGGELPRRACELVAKANSVLASRPYQKNIQTGTFRMWKDLTRGGEGRGERWASLWPFERPSGRASRPWLFEGYPSFMWTRVFGFARRSPLRFADLVDRARRMGISVKTSRAVIASVSADPDLADAAALALGGACLHGGGRLLVPFPGFEAHPALAREGWIAGVAPVPDGSID